MPPKNVRSGVLRLRCIDYSCDVFGRVCGRPSASILIPQVHVYAPLNPAEKSISPSTDGTGATGTVFRGSKCDPHHQYLSLEYHLNNTQQPVMTHKGRTIPGHNQKNYICSLLFIVSSNFNCPTTGIRSLVYRQGLNFRVSKFSRIPCLNDAHTAP